MRHFCEVEAVIYMSKQSLNYQSFSDAIPSLRFFCVWSVLKSNYFVITWDLNYVEAILTNIL